MTFHDPIPDGKTGPFMREPHAKNQHGAIGDTFDERCPKCQADTPPCCCGMATGRGGCARHG